jgi:hypothetical protein
MVSCKKKMDREYKSAEIDMANGKASSWVLTDYTGKPKSVGITLSAAALDGLPATGAGHELHNEKQLPLLPWAASKTPFNHIVINWNPEGHGPPNNPYLPPHFDFHFYMMTSAERMTIPVYSVTPAGFNNVPAAAYLPANYVRPGPEGEPNMGAHWIDTTSPELNGSPFTETFVYGTYNSRVNFMEPMITQTFLKNTTDFSRAIPRPAKVQISAYYPQTLHVYQKDGNYIIALENMEYRTAE